MSETTINGCKIGSYSRMAKKCRKCSNKECCNNKRMEAEAYIIGVDMAAGEDFTAHTSYGRSNGVRGSRGDWRGNEKDILQQQDLTTRPI